MTRPESRRPRGLAPKPAPQWGVVGGMLAILGITTGRLGGLLFLLAGIGLVVGYLWAVVRWERRRGVPGWKVWKR